MKYILLSNLALCLLGSTATAACHDFTTDSVTKVPDVIICFDTKCDLTSLEVQCNGGGNNFTSYAVGWTFGYTYNVQADDDGIDEYILWKGEVVPPVERGRIRIFELNDGLAVELE